jgi:hypothetical protein
MAALTIALSGSGVANGSRNYTVSDADLARLLAWAKAATKPNDVGSDTRTDAQVLAAWADYLVRHTKRSVQQFEIPKTLPAEIGLS